MFPKKLTIFDANDDGAILPVACWCTDGERERDRERKREKSGGNKIFECLLLSVALGNTSNTLMSFLLSQHLFEHDSYHLRIKTYTSNGKHKARKSKIKKRKKKK